MSLELVTAPAVEPISLQEAKDHLKVDSTDEDALIEALIQGARQHVDGRDGWLGRQLITATWDLTLQTFPATDFILLPLPPIQSVTSITYTDTDGDSQTFASSKWSLSNDLNWRPRVDLAYGETWPSTRTEADTVVVRFVSGYGVQADVPAPIRAGMLLLIAHWYEHRSAGESVNITEVPRTVDALLEPYRIWRL